MFRAFFLVLFLALLAATSLGQDDLQKLVDSEHAFAQMAADQNTRDAFLAYMADTAVVFSPERTEARPFWSARAANGTLLSWAPNFADVSSNGAMGYTTGNWQWQEKREAGVRPSAFGDFITVWMRQPGGNYKWVVDIGVTHDKPNGYSSDWKTAPKTAGKGQPSDDFASEFYLSSAASGVAKAYQMYADDEIRSYREGKLAILGKKNVLAEFKAEKADFAFAKRGSSLTAGDLGYILSTYSKSKGGKQIEQGNYLQIWKFSAGKWHIVLDVFKPVPA